MGLLELLITFRETLEATLIIGILYTFLVKTDRKDLLGKLWLGVGVALFASLLSAILFQVLAGGFSGRAEEIFEGVVMTLAAFTLSFMIVWMAKNKNISQKLQTRAQSAIVRGEWGIFSLAFLAVYREGIETILFLYGIVIKEGTASPLPSRFISSGSGEGWEVIFISSLMGAVLAVLIGYLIFLRGVRVSLKTFFNVTSLFLILVSAGLLAHGIHEFEEAGVLPYFGALWDVNPSLLQNGNYPVFHEKGEIGSLAVSLLGWNGNPSLPEVLAWFGSVTGIGFLWKRASVN